MNHKVIVLWIAWAALLPAWQDRASSFEVAEIKPSDPSVLKPGKGRMLPGGQIAVPGYTLRELIMFTYGVTDDMISGGPKWVNDERYDIVAKAPSGAPDTALRAMMQALLKDRFRLVTHQEDKPMSAYALTAIKSATPPAPAPAPPPPGGPGPAPPVADQTGLSGQYDLQFEVGQARKPFAGEGPSPDPFDTDGPNIFAALQKIGLHLESKKIPMPAIVIDGAERPSSN